MNQNEKAGGTVGNGASTVEASPGKKPYRAPSLSDLGSLRDLTLGGTGSVTDGGRRQPA